MKTKIILLPMLILCSNVLNASSIGKLEAYNILQNELNKNVSSTISNKEKYNFDFVKKDKKVMATKWSKLTNLEVSKIMELYYLNEFSSAKYLLNNMNSKIETKYKKLFNLMLEINIKVSKNVNVKNEVVSLVNFGINDYFITNEIINTLVNADNYKLAIKLIDSMDSTSNVIVKKLDLDNYKIETRNILEKYKNTTNNLKLLKARMGDFQVKIGYLLEAYDTYKNFNFNKVNNDKIANVSEQIKFRVKAYNSKEYAPNQNKYEKRINKTSPFKVYNITTED